jgi:hypothetical protein
MADIKERLRELEGELSPRHLAFARSVASGHGSITEAYQELYPDSSPSATATHAYRLLGKREIKEYIQLLCGQAAEDFIVNKEGVLAALWDLQSRYGDDPKASGAVAASLKTLLDHLAPRITKTAVELTGKDGGPVHQKHTNKGMSDDMARAIFIGTLGLSEAQAARMLGDKEPEGEESP